MSKPLIVKPNYFNFTKCFKNYLTNYRIFVVIGEKNIGKSFSGVRYVQNRFIQHGERFLYLRRTGIEAEDFCSNVSLERELWDNFFIVKKKIYYQPSLEVKPKWAGDVDYLSGTMSSRSKQNEGFYNLIFDEFVGEKYEMPIRYATEKLYKIISNYARNRLKDFRVIMLGNFNNLRNEFLNAWGVEAPDDGGYVEMPELSLVVYFSEQKAKYAEMNKQYKNTALAGLTKNETLLDYFVNNKTDDFVDLYLPLSQVEVETYRYGMVLREQRTYHVVSVKGRHESVVIPADRKIPELKYYCYDLKVLAEDGRANLPFNAREQAFSLLTQIRTRRILFSDMSVLDPLLRDLVQLISISFTEDYF